MPREERVPVAAEIRRRLKPGAPFVAVHLTVADGEKLGGGDRAGIGRTRLNGSGQMLPRALLLVEFLLDASQFFKRNAGISRSLSEE